MRQSIPNENYHYWAKIISLNINYRIGVNAGIFCIHMVWITIIKENEDSYTDSYPSRLQMYVRMS